MGDMHVEESFFLGHRAIQNLLQYIIIMSSKVNPKVYMDIQIGSKGAGRIIFELFTDFTPKTAENFRGLCTGDYSNSNQSKLSYQNSKFHRIVDGFVIQGGDITNGNGTGGFSIYGRTFNDESFARKHSCAGLLSMANNGRNTNSSQFFLTLKACPHLDDRHVVFGQVIDGMEVVRQISKVSIDKKDKPRIPVIIIDCGEIGDFKSFLTYDPFQKSAQQRIRIKREEIIKDQHLMRKLLAEGIDPNEAYNYKRKLQRCQKDLTELLKEEKLIALEEQDKQLDKEKKAEQQNEEEQAAAKISERIKDRLGQKNVNRLLDIKMKINQAKYQNSKAALDEQIRENDINYKKMLRRQEWEERNERAEKQIAAKGLDKSKLYLNRNSLKKERQTKQDQSFGWNVFGEQAYYKAYHRRCEKLEINQEKYAKQMQNPDLMIQPDEKDLELLASNIVKEEEQRSEFSRRRVFDEDDKVTYINDRNRVFNKKLDRSYGQFTSKIQTALEMNSLKN